MPVALSYPGVYIEEVPSGVRTITGVATSITAFVGRALRGPVDDPLRILKLLRTACSLGFNVDASTLSAAKAHGSLLQRVVILSGVGT